MARAARVLGLRLGFDNHAGELRPLDGGGTFLDALRGLPEDLLELELDLGWAWEAGVDPAELVASTAGRSPHVHVKDFRGRGDAAFCPVGEAAVVLSARRRFASSLWRRRPGVTGGLSRPDAGSVG